jgi:hypothetical protein
MHNLPEMYSFCFELQTRRADGHEVAMLVEAICLEYLVAFAHNSTQ